MGFISKTGSSPTRQVQPFSRDSIQTKLTVSKAADPAEKEADSVAKRVVDEQKNKVVETKKADSSKEEPVPTAQLEAKPDNKKEGIQTKEKKEEVQKKTSENEEKKVAKNEARDDKKDKIAKKEETNSNKKPIDAEKEASVKPQSNHRQKNSSAAATMIMQKPQQVLPFTALGRNEGAGALKQGGKDDAEQDEAKMQAIEQKINAKKGSGRSLGNQVKSEMETSFKHDFSKVKIHTDNESAELCSALNAHAFAIGNDVFFNTGKYNPESEVGKELLAHELTHVVQQKNTVQRAVVYRNPVPGGMAASTNAGKVQGDKIIIPTLEVPQFKSRSASIFGSSVTRTKKYNRKTAAGGKKQMDVWKNDPEIAGGIRKTIADKKDKAGKKPSSPDVYYFKWKGIKLFGTEEQLIENSKIPLWNASGEVSAYDVDHIKELQLGGKNQSSNMELLNFSGNRSSGTMIDNNIRKKVENFIKQTNQNFSVDDALKDYEIEFEKVLFTEKTDKSSKGSGKDGFWSFEQIQHGKHLEKFTRMSEREIEQIGGKEDNPVVFTSEIGGAMLRNDSLKSRIPGFEGSVNLQKNGLKTGAISGKFNPNPKIFNPLDNISINIYKMDGVDFGGFMKRRNRGSGNLESMLSNLRVKGLSPVEIDFAEMLPTGIVARGRIIPTVKIIEGLEIDFSIEGDKIELSKTFSAGDFKSIPPPFKVSDASLTIFGGSKGIGIRGNIDFEISKVGKGQITGSGSSSGLFELEGKFEFDKKIFDKASVEMKYSHQSGGEDKWEVKGNIQIPEGKVSGIKKADITVGYDGTTLIANGEADFNIPGIEHGKLGVTYDGEQMLIEGEADLKHKAIKSGKVTAKVKKIGDVYSVALTGSARPNIPGIDTELAVTYEDGMINITGTVAYTKGRLSGSATIGVTNQTVGADGRPSGGYGKNLTIYGGGTLTLRITDWLQGTANVTFKQDGSVEVVGKIGIPSAVNLFPKKEIKKDVFKPPTIEIPLFAIPVGSRSIGLVATIGGGAEAYASIGPGQLAEAAVEVKYNPAEEENMSVTGEALFRVPAEAGLRLYVRAGVGLSIGIARIAGGIELSGALGIEGAVEAGVKVNWTPTQGFVLDAQASLSVQPKFKFDVNAYLEAVLDLWVTEFRKEWKHNLLAFEYGPAMRFGVKFPIHYEENKPFDIALKDVQFEVPNINVGDFAKGVGKKLLG